MRHIVSPPERRGVDIGTIKAHAFSRTRSDTLNQTEFFFHSIVGGVQRIAWRANRPGLSREFVRNSGEIAFTTYTARSKPREAGSLAAGCDSALRQLSYSSCFSLSLSLSLLRRRKVGSADDRSRRAIRSPINP